MTVGYTSDTICLMPDALPDTYVASLLKDKLNIINKHTTNGTIVDVCCGNGNYLKVIKNIKYGIGIDFSYDFIKTKNDSIYNFICADGRQIPIKDNSADLTYSLSALYALKNPQDIIQEMVRITKPQGLIILDLVNRRSLNGISSMHMDAYQPMGLLTVPEMKRIIADQNLKVVEHQSFQILPYWSDRPRYLLPLLLPFWGKLMKYRVKNKMLDQWVSEAPFFRHFAGRHLFVCQKQI